MSLKNYSEARKFYRECLELDQKTRGKESVEYVKKLMNLGEVIEKMGDYHLALERFD